jgi:hypothetical protein
LTEWRAPDFFATNPLFSTRAALTFISSAKATRTRLHFINSFDTARETFRRRAAQKTQRCFRARCIFIKVHTRRRLSICNSGVEICCKDARRERERERDRAQGRCARPVVRGAGGGGEWRMQMSRLCFALKRSRSHNLCKVFNLIQHTRAGWLVGLLAVRRRSIMFFALGCDLRSAEHDLQKAIRGGDHSRWKLWPQPPAKKPRDHGQGEK